MQRKAFRMFRRKRRVFFQLLLFHNPVLIFSILQQLFICLPFRQSLLLFSSLSLLLFKNHFSIIAEFMKYQLFILMVIGEKSKQISYFIFNFLQFQVFAVENSIMRFCEPFAKIYVFSVTMLFFDE